MNWSRCLAAGTALQLTLLSPAAVGAGLQLEEALRDSEWTPTPRLSGLYRAGDLYLRDEDGDRHMIHDCMEPREERALEAAAPLTLRLQGLLYVPLERGGAERVQLGAPRWSLVSPGARAVTPACLDKLLTLRDLDGIFLVEETLEAALEARSCGELTADGSWKEAPGDCDDVSAGPVVFAYRTVSLRDYLGLQPGEDHSPQRESSCQEQGQRAAEERRWDALAEQRRQAFAPSLRRWEQLEAEVTDCLSRPEGERLSCRDRVDAWIVRAAALQLELPAMELLQQTDCGARRIQLPAAARSLSPPELEEAGLLRDALEAGLQQAVSGPSLSGYAMRSIPAGTFQMGSEDSAAEEDEAPVRSVSISHSYWIGETEITQSLYQRVTGRNPSAHVDPARPAERVSWFEAILFANALSEREGLAPCYRVQGREVQWPEGVRCEGYRLPTEAEWERAARAGSTLPYSGGKRPHRIGWHAGNVEGWGRSPGPQPVAQRRPNDWGLYDMSGNVWEWVWDRYGAYPSEAAQDPLGYEAGDWRVSRGGSWGNEPVTLRVSYRYGSAPEERHDDLGFRLVRTQPSEDGSEASE